MKFNLFPLFAMKRLQTIGTLLFALVMVASAACPAEVQALLPASLHDVFTPDTSIICGAATVFTGISRKARGLANLGGLKSIILIAEEDLSDDWPQAKDIVAGVLSVAPPLKAGSTGVQLKFDLNTARVKSSRKGEIGFQTVDVDGECKFAGYEATQIAAIDKTINQGGVAICVYKDGSRVVCGTQLEPLMFQDSTDSGAKGDDKNQMDFKFAGSGYAFHPPMLAPTVVIPLPA